MFAIGLADAGTGWAEDRPMSGFITGQFRSDSLQKDMPYCLWVPTGQAAGDGRWPLLLVLHGRGRNERSLSEQPGVMASFVDLPFAVAFPRGDSGWWIDSPVNPKGRYGATLLEFIKHVEETYPVGGSREKRAVTGWSMGGYGAVNFAEDHPDIVGSVSAMIGLLNLPYGDTYTTPADVFGPRSDVWQDLCPALKVESLRGMPVAVFSCSDDFDRPHNDAFHAAMETAGIAHHFEIIPGGHKMTTVLAAWPKVLAFHRETWK